MKIIIIQLYINRICSNKYFVCYVIWERKEREREREREREKKIITRGWDSLWRWVDFWRRTETSNRGRVWRVPGFQHILLSSATMKGKSWAYHYSPTRTLLLRKEKRRGRGGQHLHNLIKKEEVPHTCMVANKAYTFYPLFPNNSIQCVCPYIKYKIGKSISFQE